MVQDLYDNNPHLIFYTILAGSLIIIRMPLIGRYFRTVNTLLHESGHAIAAILTSGEVMNIELSSDTSGSAYTRSGSKFKAMFVSFAGYPAAALFSGILIAFAVSGKPISVFFILLSISLLNLALFVRNFYGIVWLLTFSGLVLLIYWLENDKLNYVFSLSVSLISLSESLVSTVIILYLSLIHPRKAGDATNLAKTSKIPAAIWGILISMLVGIILYYTVIHFFPFPLKPVS
jgi:hypothetical protein